MNLSYTKTDPRDQIKCCKQKQFVLFLICMLILFAQRREDIFVINSIYFRSLLQLYANIWFIRYLFMKLSKYITFSVQSRHLQTLDSGDSVWSWNQLEKLEAAKAA